MAKFAKYKVFLILLLTVLAVLSLLLFASPGSPSRGPGSQAPAAETTAPAVVTEPAGTEPSVTEPAVSGTEPHQTVPSEHMLEADPLSFPLMADNEFLRVEAPFSYDGINPDCDLSESRNIAAVMLQNMSDQHLLQADLTLTLADGSRITFRAEHIPSGKRVMAFAIDNAVLPADAPCVDIDCTTEYASPDAGAADAVQVTTEGAVIRVTNVTSAPIEKIVIYCHDLLGEEYWGGKAYSYEVSNITAGETVTVEALDCILGLAEAAYIDGIHE